MSISLANTLSLSMNSVATRQNTGNLLSLRDQMTDLQRQLATGMVTTDYAGLGTDASKALGVEKTLSRYGDYSAAITDGNLRLKLMDTSLTAIAKQASTVASATVSGGFGNLGGTGQTTAQLTSKSAMQAVIDALNQNSAGRYLFSGRATDVQPVVDYDTMINGTATQAGLKQIIAERKAADNTNGSGNLTATATGNVVSILNASTSVGLQAGSPGSSNAGVAVATVAGPPAGSTVTFNSIPSDGDTVQVTLTLPDNSTKTLTFTARAGAADPTKNEFQIGATPAATANGLAGVVTSTLQTVAATDLQAASAMRASNDFFGATAATPYTRLTATPNPAGTVQWYQGDTTSPSARDTASVQVGDNQSVSIGAQANEAGFRTLLARLGVLATETFDATATNDPARYSAMISRASPSAVTTGQTLTDIQTQLGLASATLDTAKKTNTARGATLQDTLDSIEQADTTKVATALADLQTRLQASYTLTSTMSKLSLVNYLG
jgi:flagellar hook-associated protein 3 FlgL